jgi:thymidylate kinase
MAQYGKLFVFEGADGSGKTTVSRAFAEHAKAAGFESEWFSFPGRETGTLGKHVYDVHHDPLAVGIKAINPTSLQLLHIAAHIDTIERHIIPALKRGRHVVLDRYWWSTLVYGVVAVANKQSLKAMVNVERLHWAKIRPACVFLVRRKTPLGEGKSLEDTSIANEYDKLATQEARKYPVIITGNDEPLAEVMESIIRRAKLGKPVRSGLIQVPPSVNGETCAKSQPGVANPRVVFSKLDPAKQTIVYDTYWRFAAERQAMFFRRFAGAPPTWTNDTVLREYKFTNAYRASDRTSQYLIREVIYAGDQARDEVFFRTMLFKVFNRIETWELLTRKIGHITYGDYSFARYDAVLTEAINSGATIYSGAYIMPSGGPSSANGRKHRMHLKLIEQMLKDDLAARLVAAPSMGKAFDLLRAYSTIGDFLAYQYVTDLNYSTLLNFSEMEFVVPGPGARDGIRKCFSDLGGLNEIDIIKLVAERQQVEFERLGLDFQSLWGRPLQLIDCQNLFCEVDKYSRVRHPEFAGRTGRTRIKQKYRITPDPILYWYPPKWGLNDRIAKGGMLVSRI